MSFWRKVPARLRLRISAAIVRTLSDPLESHLGVVGDGSLCRPPLNWNRQHTGRALYVKLTLSFEVLVDRSRCHREPPTHLCAWNNASPLCDDDSPTQEHKIRNRLNPKLSGERRALLGVDLED